MEFTVIDNKDENRFEARIDGKTAFIEYKPTEHKLILTHTEVPKELEGKGIASGMVKEVLKEAEKRKLKVDPECPFIAGYLKRHPEYEGHIAE
ncbi:GNAT family N-acetyltransferase [Marixanthomonas spongiae]|uniref:N-acetyltransferase n=1 Tax=Marixanthomonas spongiae TaxID=2174845 RepID=A0A2U0I7E7_9FLAO|nr:GNAT family N-acetyltransferase [Marixanthomonas spongiae]PVW17004.1 N-acetyltransferase [Marixanthomonas spongiae]